jgi:hypothetical protein
LHLGDTLNNLRRWEEAVEVYNKGLAQKPNHPELHSALATTLKNMGQLTASYKQSLAAAKHSNNHVSTMVDLMVIQRDLAIWKDLVDREKGIMIRIKSMSKQKSVNFPLSPYHSLYMAISAQQLKEVAEAYFFGISKVKSASRSLSPTPGEQQILPRKSNILNIGYISTRFKNYAGAQVGFSCIDH